MASYDLTRIPALRDLQELGRRQKNVTDGLGQRVSALETNAPTKVSDLTNDKKYQTETEVSAAINKAVAAADHLKRKSVASTGNIDLKAADANSTSTWSRRVLPVPPTSTTSTWLSTACWKRWATGKWI